jgi:uncharacterized protein (DUF433 family)
LRLIERSLLESQRTRISVEFILELLANGWDTEQIFKNYPRPTKEDILAIEYSLKIL